MKKLAVMGIIMFAAFALISCGQEEEPAAAQAPAEEAVEPAAAPSEFEDGMYFAQEDEFSGSGWKYVVSFEIENGEFVWADWNGVHRDSGPDKKTLDRMGLYGMVARGGALAEWYEQAELVESYLLETQDPAEIPYGDDGKTDAVSGVTITISSFVELTQQALAEGPVGRGPYEDGLYFAAQRPDGRWTYTLAMNVISGYIAGVNWSGFNEDGQDKKAVDRAGEYQMVARGGAQAEWYEQAELVEAYLLETQDPADIPYGDDGKTDAVSGVTITISSFAELAEKALGAGPASEVVYEDGTYYAEAEEFSSSGWKSFVDIMVVNGFIVDVDWNAVNEDGEDKKSVDMAGDYQMVARGGAIDEWYVQAQRAEEHLLHTQDPRAVDLDDSGRTDAVSGVTINISDLVTLADQALEGARR